jgi:putative (di)nucleoside polyphosphate hydrolase
MSLIPFADRPYREGVGIALFNRNGHVFVGRRTDTEEAAWQMPQGGIDAGETAAEAAVRELGEEVGTTKAEIIRPSRGWLEYDLPPDLADKVWHGRYRGQRQMWFALRFLGDDRDIDLDTHEAEFADWRWVPLGLTPSLIVPFKRPLYELVVAEFESLALPA